MALLCHLCTLCVTLLLSCACASWRDGNSLPYGFGNRLYIRQCAEMESRINRNSDMLIRMDYAWDTSMCYLSAYFQMLKTHRQKADFSRDILPPECVATEKGAKTTEDPTMSMYLRLQAMACLMQSHTSAVCRLLPPHVQNVCLKRLGMCAEEAVPMDTHPFDGQFPMPRLLHCLVGAFYSSQMSAHYLPPLRGPRALVPLRSIEDWLDIKYPLEEKIPLKIKRWGKVYFASTDKFSDEFYSSIWTDRINTNIDNVDIRLMRILAAHVGSLSYTVVNKNRFHWNVDVWVSPEYSVESKLLPHAQQDVCLLTRRRRTAWRSIFNTFSIKVCIFTAVACLAVAAVLRSAGQRSTAWETVRTFLTGSVGERPRPLLSVLSIPLSANGLFQVGAFLGLFLSFLTIPGEPVQPQTLEKMEPHLTKIYSGIDIKDLFKTFAYNDVARRLERKIARFEYASDEKQLQEIISGEAAVLHSTTAVEVYHRSPFAVDSLMRPLTHIVPQCLLSPAYVSFGVRPGWAHREQMSDLLQRLVEGGVQEKLQSDYWHHGISSGGMVFLRHSHVAGDRRPLTMWDIVYPSIMLGVGLSLAALVFVVEVVVGRMQQLRRAMSTFWKCLCPCSRRS